VKPLLIVCDFDGTITQRDTLHVLVEHYGAVDLWDMLGPRLRAGEITVEEAMQMEFDQVRVSPADAYEVVRRHAPLRPGFAEFVAWCREAGHRLFVLSNGFRSIIEPLLADAGMGHLEVVAHDAEFSTTGTRLIWTDRGPRCPLCDRPCKRHPLRERWDGERLVYLGDGISDRCVAGLADVLFARDFLAEDLADEGVAFNGFDDFHEVQATLAATAGFAA
jgi:2-hydroxy-3-keto-5-methylthiopentenyl-1-phosphate phosphatase